METLGQHIIDFLKGHPQVYLPGIGLLKKQRTAAWFDEKTQEFRPPGSKITFQDSIKAAPDEFLQFLQSRLNLDREEAQTGFKETLGLWLVEISETGEIDVPALGRFSKGADGLAFSSEQQQIDTGFYTPVKEFNLLPPPVKPETVTPPALQHEPPAAGAEVEPEIRETADPAEAVPAEAPKQVRSSGSWPWVAAVVLLGIFAFGYWLWPAQPELNPPAQEPAEQAQTANEGGALMPPADTGGISAATTTGNDTLGSTGSKPEMSVEAEKLPEITYEIIVVSFGKLADAERYVEKMNAKGQRLHIIPNQYKRNQVKVSYGSYTSAAEAQQQLNQVRENFAKEAWIYKKINNK